MRLRIPVKWATDSGNKWARRGRASRRGKDIMTEVAHMGQEEKEESRNTSSSRVHHFVSIISFSGLDSGEGGRHSGDVGHPGMAGSRLACCRVRATAAGTDPLLFQHGSFPPDISPVGIGRVGLADDLVDHRGEVAQAGNRHGWRLLLPTFRRGKEP